MDSLDEKIKCSTSNCGAAIAMDVSKFDSRAEEAGDARWKRYTRFPKFVMYRSYTAALGVQIVSTGSRDNRDDTHIFIIVSSRFNRTIAATNARRAFPSFR